MGLFENCFTWKRGANWVGCAAVIVLFFGGIFTIFNVSAKCTAASGLMICLSLLVGALEAPPVVALCGIGENVAKRVECVKGLYRTFLYILCSFIPVALCQGSSAILAMLLLFTSGFFHFLDWLGPRGGHARQQQQKQQFQQLKNEGLLPNDDDEEIFVQEDPPQGDFFQQVTDKAGKAVAAAAVSHMQKQLRDQFNPFAKEEPPKTNPPQVPIKAPPPRVENNLSNPFAPANAPSNTDLEDNPFL